MRSDATLELIRANPLAFTLAFIIATRARWHEGFNADGLLLGEAKIGDWEKIGMSEQQYRTAKAQLVKWGFVTIKPTTKGTIAKLTDTRLFVISDEVANDQSNGQATTGQRLTKKARRKQGSRMIDYTPSARSAPRKPGSPVQPQSADEVRDYAASLGYEDAALVSKFIEVNNRNGWPVKAGWKAALHGFTRKVGEEFADVQLAGDMAERQMPR